MAAPLGIATPFGFGYVEGFAQGLELTHHAWVTINAKVIDPTWTDIASGEPVFGVFDWPAEYFGVPFPYGALARWGSMGSQLLDQSGPRPLLVSGRAPCPEEPLARRRRGSRRTSSPPFSA
jgi:hypothetical protein